jgi:MYXO-CTERM domain-containing protein
VTLLAGMLARTPLAPPGRLVIDIGAAALVGVGAFWFVRRSF